VAPADQTLSGALGSESRSLRYEPQLFLAFQGSQPWAEPSRHRLLGIKEVLLGRGTELDVSRRAGTLSAAIPDPWMSGRHAKLVRGPSGWLLEDLGSKNGTRLNGIDVTGPTPVDKDDLIEVGRTFLFIDDRCAVFPEDPDDPRASQLGAPLPELATFNAAFREQLGMLARVAVSDVPVLLLGETGSGKEVVARATHALSKRRGDFIAVNVAALSVTLIEAEIFGAKRGAYSGADQDRPGLVRAADKGTLFLDEIGDLPAVSQPAFLRVLQEREVLPVGETRAVPVNFRLVAATHRSLERLVKSGSFREDLLARMSGLRVHLPPLRERRADLGLLVARILSSQSGDGARRAAGITVSALAGRALFQHGWPQNIRELVHVLNAALALADHGVIELEHLPPVLQEAKAAPSAPPEEEEPVFDENDERLATLVRLLETHHGNVSAVAREMGCARMQIHRWLKHYRLDPERYRATE
jgi:DNA-binding NtrC family response regulator